MRLFILLSIVLFLFHRPVEAQTYSLAFSGIQNYNPLRIEWGDYDNDNDQDLLAYSQDFPNSNYILTIYRNDGNNLFTTIPFDTIIGSTHPRDCKFFDLDNDSDLDIIESHYSSSSLTSVYVNTGAGVFQPPATLLPSRGGFLSMGDMDNDGDFDIAVGGGGVTIHRNNGNMNFTQVGTWLNLQIFNNYTNWCDFNNDSFPDLCVSAESFQTLGEYHTYLYQNNSGNSFTLMNDLGDYRCQNSAGDFNNDGQDDLLLTGVFDYNTSYSAIYINNGTFSPSLLSAPLTGINNYHSVFDFNQDGYDDFLASGYTSAPPNPVIKLLLFLNNGNMTFTEIQLASPVLQEMGELEVADYDSDLDIDFAIGAVIGTGPSTLPRIYENNTLSSVSALHGADAPRIFTLFDQLIISGMGEGNKTIVIFDVNGRQVQHLTTPDQNAILHISNLAGGVYFVSIQNAKNILVDRFFRH